MSEINVTPFVDVMLVLYYIYGGSIANCGVEINLPKTSANALPTEKEQTTY